MCVCTVLAVECHVSINSITGPVTLPLYLSRPVDVKLRLSWRVAAWGIPLPCNVHLLAIQRARTQSERKKLSRSALNRQNLAKARFSAAEKRYGHFKQPCQRLYNYWARRTAQRGGCVRCWYPAPPFIDRDVLRFFLLLFHEHSLFIIFRQDLPLQVWP